MKTNNLVTCARKIEESTQAYRDETLNGIFKPERWKERENFQVENLFAAASVCCEIVRRVCNMNINRALHAFPAFHAAVTVPAPIDVDLSALAADITDAAETYEKLWRDDSAVTLCKACARYLQAAITESDALRDWGILKVINGENPVRAMTRATECLLAFTSYSGAEE